MVVENNLIIGKRDFDSSQRGNGIQLYNTQRARIVGNNISFVRDAIYVDVSHHAVFRGNRLHHSRYGTHYMNSYYNVWEDNDVWMNRGGLALMEVRDQVVRRNRVWANSDHGIMLRTIQRARVEDNIVAGNARGFFIYDAQDNVLRGNLIVDNLVGVHLSAGSIRNDVEGNDFILNREPVRYVGAKDEVWGAERGQLLEPVRRLGSRRRRSRRHALGGGRRRRSAVVAVSRHEGAAGQSGGPGAARRRAAVSAAPRAECGRSPSADAAEAHRLAGLARPVLPRRARAPMTAGPAIEIRGVVRHYGPVRAVDGVDLVIERGVIFGLLGHNGAGKSTLFRMLLGLERPTSGDIRIDGVPIDGR